MCLSVRPGQAGLHRRYDVDDVDDDLCGQYAAAAAGGQDDAVRALRCCPAAVGPPWDPPCGPRGTGMGVDRAGGEAARRPSAFMASAATSTLPLAVPPAPAAAPQEAVAPSLLPDLSDRFSLSTSRVWNLLRLDVDSLLGGLEPADLHGDCRLFCDVRDDVLEKWRDVDECMAWERCAGEPTTKSLPGEVDRDGPSDLHSDTFRLRQFCGLEHSELRLDRPLL